MQLCTRIVFSVIQHGITLSSRKPGLKLIYCMLTLVDIKAIGILGVFNQTLVGLQLLST